MFSERELRGRIDRQFRSNDDFRQLRGQLEIVSLDDRLQWESWKWPINEIAEDFAASYSDYSCSNFTVSLERRSNSNNPNFVGNIFQRWGRFFLRNLPKQKGYIANHIQSALFEAWCLFEYMYEFFDKSSNKGQVSRGMGPCNGYWLSFSFFPKQEAIRDIAIICPLASRSTSPPSGPGKRNPLVYFYLRVSSSPNCCGLKTHVELRSKSLAGSFLLLTAHTPNHPT